MPDLLSSVGGEELEQGARSAPPRPQGRTVYASPSMGPRPPCATDLGQRPHHLGPGVYGSGRCPQTIKSSCIVWDP